MAQRKSKQNIRKNPFVLECERVKKQVCRRKKRNIDEISDYRDLEETRKNVRTSLRVNEYRRHLIKAMLKILMNVSNNFIQV